MQSKQETLRRPWGILQARDREAQNNNGAKLFLKLNSNSNYRIVASRSTSRLVTMSWPFQIAYEGDFWSLCTVTF